MTEAEIHAGRDPAIRVTAMPRDTNAYGDIFGGWLVSIMDNAAGLTAARHSKGRAVTVAMDGMQDAVPATDEGGLRSIGLYRHREGRPQQHGNRGGSMATRAPLGSCSKSYAGEVHLRRNR